MRDRMVARAGMETRLPIDMLVVMGEVEVVLVMVMVVLRLTKEAPMMDQRMMKKGTRWLVVKSMVVTWLVTCPARDGDKIKRKRTDHNTRCIKE
jgi:hypothetical protein